MAITFPEVELDASAPQPAFYKVVLAVTTKQDGQPWTDLTVTYNHMSSAYVSIVTGRLTELCGSFGPKGTGQKGQNFDLSVKLTVDTQTVANAEWNDVKLEFILAAEHRLLQMWLSMNEANVVTDKVHRKI